MREKRSGHPLPLLVTCVLELQEDTTPLSTVGQTILTGITNVGTQCILCKCWYIFTSKTITTVHACLVYKLHPSGWHHHCILLLPTRPTHMRPSTIISCEISTVHKCAHTQHAACIRMHASISCISMLFIADQEIVIF